MKTIEILVGIPCSGKSTYTNNKLYLNNNLNFGNSMSIMTSVSRDSVRENSDYFLQPYLYCEANEKIVTMVCDNMLNDNMYDYIILDNTHCKEKYINDIINNYPNHRIVIKFFKITLLKAYIRNIKRFISTRKYVPFKIIKNMYKNYKKINKDKYEKYIHM